MTWRQQSSFLRRWSSASRSRICRIERPQVEERRQGAAAQSRLGAITWQRPSSLTDGGLCLWSLSGAVRCFPDPDPQCPDTIDSNVNPGVDQRDDSFVASLVAQVLGLAPSRRPHADEIKAHNGLPSYSAIVPDGGTTRKIFATAEQSAQSSPHQNIASPQPAQYGRSAQPWPPWRRGGTAGPSVRPDPWPTLFKHESTGPRFTEVLTVLGGRGTGVGRSDRRRCWPEVGRRLHLPFGQRHVPWAPAGASDRRDRSLWRLKPAGRRECSAPGRVPRRQYPNEQSALTLAPLS